MTEHNIICVHQTYSIKTFLKYLQWLTSLRIWVPASIDYIKKICMKFNRVHSEYQTTYYTPTILYEYYYDLNLL